MNNSKPNQIAALFASLSFIVMLGMNFIQVPLPDETTLAYICTKILPATIVMWFLGFVLGKIIDKPKTF